MEVFRVKLVTIVLAFGLIAGAGIGAFLYYLLPQFFPNWYFQIVFFFIILQSVLIYFVASSSEKVSSQKMVNLYLLAKVIKIITSLGFITIYALAVKENIKSFVLVFIVFYLLYLFLETLLHSKIEKRIKSKNTTEV